MQRMSHRSIATTCLLLTQSLLSLSLFVNIQFAKKGIHMFQSPFDAKAEKRNLKKHQSKNSLFECFTQIRCDIKSQQCDSTICKHESHRFQADSCDDLLHAKRKRSRNRLALIARATLLRRVQLLRRRYVIDVGRRRISRYIRCRR